MVWRWFLIPYNVGSSPIPWNKIKQPLSLIGRALVFETNNTGSIPVGVTRGYVLLYNSY